MNNQAILYYYWIKMNKHMELEKFAKTLNILYIVHHEDYQSTLYKIKKYCLNIHIEKNEKEGLETYNRYYQKSGEYYDIVIIDSDTSNPISINIYESLLAQNHAQEIIVISQSDTYFSKLKQIGIYHLITMPLNEVILESNILQVASILQKKEMINKQSLKIETIQHDLLSAQKKAEESSHQKSYFLANMSHEIRTPLNAIMGFITLLHENETDKEKLKYLKILKTSSDTLLQVINDILDITKIESGKLLIDKLPFNPYEKLLNTTELFEVPAAKKGVIFKVNTSRSLPEILIGDSFRIKQILSNLLSNAIKFTPSGSKVKCVIWYAQGTLNIKVKDYGIGIVKEKHEYIFEAFHQADNIMATEYGGTGLGLALSTELARLLGGALNFKDNKVGGSIFSLSIKLPSSNKKPLLVESQQTDHSNIQLKGHVLIVDDVEANRLFLSIVLQNLNLTYDMVENGIQAIEKCNQNTYDLILMDENMPKLRGSQAAKEIKKSEKMDGKKPTPIISLTANALKGDEQRLLDAGMDGYLSKPVEPHTLISTLRKYL